MYLRQSLLECLKLSGNKEAERKENHNTFPRFDYLYTRKCHKYYKYSPCWYTLYSLVVVFSFSTYDMWIASLSLYFFFFVFIRYMCFASELTRKVLYYNKIKQKTMEDIYRLLIKEWFDGMQVCYSCEIVASLKSHRAQQWTHIQNCNHGTRNASERFEY